MVVTCSAGPGTDSPFGGFPLVSRVGFPQVFLGFPDVFLPPNGLFCYVLLCFVMFCYVVLRPVTQTHLRPELGRGLHILVMFRTNLRPINMSSCQKTEFDMQKKTLASKTAQNWVQDRINTPEVCKTYRPMFWRRIARCLCSRSVCRIFDDLLVTVRGPSLAPRVAEMSNVRRCGCCSQGQGYGHGHIVV